MGEGQELGQHTLELGNKECCLGNRLCTAFSFFFFFFLQWLWLLYLKCGENRLTLDCEWVILERWGFRLALTFLKVFFYSWLQWGTRRWEDWHGVRKLENGSTVFFFSIGSIIALQSVLVSAEQWSECAICITRVHVIHMDLPPTPPESSESSKLSPLNAVY